MLHKVEKKLRKLGGNVPTILVGDWNSRPESTTYLLAKHQKPVTKEFMEIEFQYDTHEKLRAKRLERLP